MSTPCADSCRKTSSLPWLEREGDKNTLANHTLFVGAIPFRRDFVPPTSRASHAGVSSRALAACSPMLCSAACLVSGGLGQERELDRDLAVFGVDRRDRIVAGKAGVAKPGGEPITPHFAQSAIEPVDRQKGEAVDPDQLCHSLDVEACRKQLIALRRGDAVIAGVARRRA